MENMISTAEMVNSTQVIHIGPVFVYSVIISGDGANADADIYDGENDKAERKFHLEALSGTTNPAPANSKIRFNKGIYIKVNAATTFVTVIFRPLEPGDTEHR